MTTVTTPSCRAVLAAALLAALAACGSARRIAGAPPECARCHGAPPATGAHLVHASPAAPSILSYGALHVLEDVAPLGGPGYDFGCGHCHPLDPAAHLAHVTPPQGGVRVADLVLDPAGAPTTSLKGRNLPGAAYDRATGTCSGVYCHSSGQDPAAVTTLAFETTPSWTSAGSLGCDGCHGNPPSYPSGGAGAADANSHLGLEDFGWETGHFTGMPGPAHWFPTKHGGASHGFMDADPFPAASPITCQACHAETVDPENVTTGGFFWLDTTGDYRAPGGDESRLTNPIWFRTQCSSCHFAGGPAPVKAGRVLPLRHVNGRRDVSFDRRPSLPAGYGGQLPPVTGPVPPYYVTYFTGQATQGYTEFPVDGVLLATSVASQPVFATSLESAAYDPASKTCSNVGCHVGRQSLVDAGTLGPLRWGEPYGSASGASCGKCHEGY